MLDAGGAPNGSCTFSTWPTLHTDARNGALSSITLMSECTSLRFGAIAFGERSDMLLVRVGKVNKTRSVLLNASAREALTVYAAPRLGLGDGDEVEEKKRVGKVSLRVLLGEGPRS
jgi:hypothetical protein